MFFKSIRGRFFCILAVLCIPLCGISLTAYGKNKIPDRKFSHVQTIENMDSSDNYEYGIGSVSKLFGTVAVMKLAEEGKIDLNKPLTDYIPEFSMADERYRKITPLMLLNHSSGIMGTTSHNGFLYGSSDSDYHDTFLGQLKNQQLKAKPGTYSVYCNDGFMLTEILVERVSGMPFSEYLKKELSEPCGLTNTMTSANSLDESLLAPNYFYNHILPYVNCQTLVSGGIYGTPGDLCRFSQIFMKDNKLDFLSNESVELMSRPWYLEDDICIDKGDTQIGYGLGWDCVNAYPYNLYGIKALTKGGDVKGYHANLTVLPDQNLSIAITASGGTSSYLQEAAQDIILEVLKEEGLIDAIKDIKIKGDNTVDAAPLPDELRQFEGYYISQNMLEIMFDKEGTLLLTPLDSEYDTTQEYVYTESGEFVSTKGFYLNPMGICVSNANGSKGLTKFSFRKEANGKTYIIGTTYESTMGLGETAYTTAFAEKVEPNSPSEKVLAKWEKRYGKKYYIVGETFNSDAYLNDCSIEFKPMEKVAGFVAGYYQNESKNKCRIVDENTAKCEIDLPGMIGRDLTDYNFSKKGNVEYVSVGSYCYIGEEAVQPSEQFMNGTIVIGEDAAIWYKISDKDAAAIINIIAPEEGAYYVYDKEDNCIASSLFKEEADSVVLPAGGCIAFVGKEGSKFNIIRE